MPSTQSSDLQVDTNLKTGRIFVVIAIERLMDTQNYDSWTFTLKIGKKLSPIDFRTRYFLSRKLLYMLHLLLQFFLISIQLYNTTEMGTQGARDSE